MEHEAVIRLSIFLGLFTLFAMIEAQIPRRARSLPRRDRWITAWSLTVLNTLTLRVMAMGLPLLAVGASAHASTQGWGLLNAFSLPSWIEIMIAILVLDFAIWVQHLVTHKVPLLWRLHRVHHADRDMDVTTAIRFHPVEIALSMLIKICVVYALGPAAVAVIIFEIILNGTALFNHANMRLPLAVDRVVRLILVTPDMHRVHHSVHRQEHDSNYGFALSIWDRMFGTFVAQPEAGHDDMEIGLSWRDERPAKLGWSLWLPFQKK